MPTFRIHGVESQQVATITKQLFEQLTEIYNVPADHINLQVMASTWLGPNGLQLPYPMVEVLALQRPKEVEDRVAQSLSLLLKEAGYPESELYFLHLDPKHYYCDGIPCQ